MERTVVLVKPDGVQRGLVGQIMNRFERKGLCLLIFKNEEIFDYQKSEYLHIYTDEEQEE